MKTESLIIVVALAGLALWYVSAHPEVLGGKTVAQQQTDRLKSIIGAIPPDPRFLPHESHDIGALQGAANGALAGAAFGPFGAGIGAGVGAVASLFS